MTIISDLLLPFNSQFSHIIVKSEHYFKEAFMEHFDMFTGAMIPLSSPFRVIHVIKRPPDSVSYTHLRHS